MPPILISPDDLRMHRITKGDTVRLGVLAGPEISPVTVILESWDAAGSQPPNSHPRSTELFLFLRGQGIANCDGKLAGQLCAIFPAHTLRYRVGPSFLRDAADAFEAIIDGSSAGTPGTDLLLRPALRHEFAEFTVLRPLAGGRPDTRPAARWDTESS